MWYQCNTVVKEFLSTLSLRRATHACGTGNNRRCDFYPRSPCGERPVTARIIDPTYDFYPRSPCGERQAKTALYRSMSDFYPRSPCGERLIGDKIAFEVGDFYPRSPCGERRLEDWQTSLNAPNFYPRSPCGERLLADCTKFYTIGISIHALLAESDLYTSARMSGDMEFLSTLSLRRAT